MELHLFVLQERKNIFLARQISGQQRGAVMAFIPDQISVNDGALVVIRGRKLRPSKVAFGILPMVPL